MTVREWARTHLPPDLVLGVMRLLAVLRRRQPKSTSALLARLGDPACVLAGPFAGLRGLQAMASPLPALLMGCYERELHGALETIIRAEPDVVLNIGSGEGYYAVGMAMRLPDARVLAWDIDPLCAAATRRTAAANAKAHQIEIFGRCTVAELERRLAIARRPALLSDCEGAESELLDPVAAPALVRAIVLVEVHDQFVPGITDTVRERFESSHHISLITAAPRNNTHLPPGLPELSSEDSERALSDGRVGAGRWLLMLPRTAPAS